MAKGVDAIRLSGEPQELLGLRFIEVRDRHKTAVVEEEQSPVGAMACHREWEVHRAVSCCRHRHQLGAGIIKSKKLIYRPFGKHGAAKFALGQTGVATPAALISFCNKEKVRIITKTKRRVG